MRWRARLRADWLVYVVVQHAFHAWARGSCACSPPSIAPTAPAGAVTDRFESPIDQPTRARHGCRRVSPRIQIPPPPPVVHVHTRRVWPGTRHDSFPSLLCVAAYAHLRTVIPVRQCMCVARMPTRSALIVHVLRLRYEYAHVTFLATFRSCAHKISRRSPKSVTPYAPQPSLYGTADRTAATDPLPLPPSEPTDPAFARTTRRSAASRTMLRDLSGFAALHT